MDINGTNFKMYTKQVTEVVLVLEISDLIALNFFNLSRFYAKNEKVSHANSFC